MTVSDVFLYAQSVPGDNDLYLVAPNGSDDANDIRLYPIGAQDIRLYSTLGAVRLSQQYVEVVQSGQSNLVRVSQQYLEVVITFGTPPVGNNGRGNGKDSAPGQQKKGEPSAYTVWLARQRRDHARHQRRWPYDAVASSSDPHLTFIAPNPDPIRTIEIMKIVKH